MIASRSLLEPVAVTFTTRPRDIDGHQHVNNAVVMEYLEIGRAAWIDHVCPDRSNQILLFLARVEVDYLREIRRGAVMTVTTRLLEVPSESAYRAIFEHVLEVKMDRADPHVAVNSRVEAVFVGATDRCLHTFADFLES